MFGCQILRVGILLHFTMLTITPFVPKIKKKTRTNKKYFAILCGVGFISDCSDSVSK